MGCSRIALGVRLLRHRSRRKQRLRSLLLSTAARDFRRSQPFLWAARASRLGSAYFVIARGGNNASARSSSAQRRAISDARSPFCGLLAHRAWGPPTSSSLAEETTPPLAPPQHSGARFPTLAATKQAVEAEKLAQKQHHKVRRRIHRAMREQPQINSVPGRDAPSLPRRVPRSPLRASRNLDRRMPRP